MAQQSTRLSLSACSIGNSVPRQLGPPWPIATASAPGICLIQSPHWLSHPTACPAGALTSARKTPCGWPIRPSFSCDDDSTLPSSTPIPAEPYHCTPAFANIAWSFDRPFVRCKTPNLKDEHISCMHHYGTPLVTLPAWESLSTRSSLFVPKVLTHSVLSALRQWRGVSETTLFAISNANRTKTKVPIALLTTECTEKIIPL
ncbi:hypothetical protein EDB80DRAFT_702591 [Ilyonectria destructans]|nr:hypothetical protein EDB80DRAFT_702591 [Ilyonectria destructans]